MKKIIHPKEKPSFINEIKEGAAIVLDFTNGRKKVYHCIEDCSTLVDGEQSLHTESESRTA